MNARKPASSARNAKPDVSGTSRKAKPVTRENKRAIEDYLAALTRAVEAKVAEYKRLSKLPGGESLLGQVEYWRHVSAGYRWARAINRQRKVVDA